MQPSTFRTLTWVGFILVLAGTAIKLVATYRQATVQDHRGGSQFEERRIGEPSMPVDRVRPPERAFALPAWLVLFLSFWCGVATSNPKTSFDLPLFCCSFGLFQCWGDWVAPPEAPNTAASYGNWIMLAGFATQLLGVIVKDRLTKRAASAAKQPPPNGGQPD